MSKQTFEEALAWATSDGTAVANSTTETILFSGFTVPGGYMADGRILKLTAFGRQSTTSTPTLTFRLRWGGVSGTVLAASGAIVTGSSVTNGLWKAELILQTRTNGASGSIFSMGQATVGDDATSTVGSATNTHGSDLMSSAGVAVPAAATVDLTTDASLVLTAQWSAASASNTITGHIFTIESLN